MQTDKFEHPASMTRSLFLIAFSFVFSMAVHGQGKKETLSYFNLIKDILVTEKTGNKLAHRLDSLKAKFIPSRSYLNDYFNRDIDLGFKHRRITINLNFSGYQIDLLCKNDTFYLSSITARDYNSISYNDYNYETIEQFLKQRNKFFSSTKTASQLIKELSFSEEYAFYCGDGMLKTQKGKYIEQLVEDENTAVLTDMLNSFNCETQTYGVAGLEMLQKREFQILDNTKKLTDHIKKRNSELIVCSGCLSGLIEKIYSRK